MAGNPIYGAERHAGQKLGYQQGRQSIINDIRAGIASSKAHSRTNSRDVLAGTIGTGQAQLITVLYGVVRDRRRAKKGDTDDRSVVTCEG